MTGSNEELKIVQFPWHKNSNIIASILYFTSLHERYFTDFYKWLDRNIEDSNNPDTLEYLSILSEFLFYFSEYMKLSNEKIANMARELMNDIILFQRDLYIRDNISGLPSHMQSAVSRDFTWCNNKEKDEMELEQLHEFDDSIIEIFDHCNRLGLLNIN